MVGEIGGGRGRRESPRAAARSGRGVDDAAVDCGTPGPILRIGRSITARRRQRRHQLGSGRPEVAARCVDRDGVSGGVGQERGMLGLGFFGAGKMQGSEGGAARARGASLSSSGRQGGPAARRSRSEHGGGMAPVEGLWRQ